MMSEYRKIIERLRGICLRFEAEKNTLLSPQYTQGKVPPCLSTTQTTAEEKEHYYY